MKLFATISTVAWSVLAAATLGLVGASLDKQDGTPGVQLTSPSDEYSE